MADLPEHLRPIPVGRERISREVVDGHQRERVLAAAAGVFADQGYRESTVEDLVSAARIGVGTFYGLFDGKEDCFLRLYDRIVEDAAARLSRASAAGGDTWEERCSAAAGELAEAIAAEPRAARVAVIEVQAAGAEAERRHARTLARAATALRHGRRDEPEPPARRPAEEAAVAGLCWLLYERLTDGQELEVGSIRAEIVEIVIAPLVGSVG